MARTIDWLLETVTAADYLPPVMREVLRSRIEPEPTQQELDEAQARLIERHGGLAGWK